MPIGPRGLVTGPQIGTQRPRLCPRDGFELVLDTEIVRTSIDAGWPAVALYRCRLGHSVRADAPHLRTGPKPQRPAYLCPACGKPVPRGKGSSRKMCSDPCSRFVAGQRARAYQRGEIFVLQEQPWYKGPARTLRPLDALPPLDPLAGRMPRCWADGWRRVYEDGRAGGVA